MRPWKISVGLTAILMRSGLDARRREIFMAAALLLDGPHRFLASPSRGTQGWPWQR